MMVMPGIPRTDRVGGMAFQKSSGNKKAIPESCSLTWAGTREWGLDSTMGISSRSMPGDSCWCASLPMDA